MLTAADVAAAVGGRLLSGDPARAIRGFSIDSRTLQPGELFFAIRGERFDGAQFVAAALGAGALGAVVGEGAAPLAADAGGAAPALIGVADTTRALQALASHVRRRSGARVVAITGSAGKTTTKEAAAELLAARYTVFRNRGNLNNHIGLPLSLLELRRRPEVAVVELGMNHAGEISTLVAIAEPEIRVWTNVGDAHLGFFESVDALAEAKAEIFEGASRDSMLVANADDARIMSRAPRFAGRVVTFGIDAPADVSASDVEDLGVDGTRALLRTPAGDTALTTPLVGRGNLANVLAGATVALTLDIPLAEIVTCAAGLEAAPHRGEVVRLRGGVVVLDDSYNSSPTALRLALDVIARERRYARKVAILGEMLELGGHAIPLHEECGRAAAASGLDELVAVGGAPAAALARAAGDAGLTADRVRHVATSDEAASLATAMVRPGDLVLVKGSRGIGTDAVVERLRAEFG